ncbi:hypothetical protein DOC39_22415 [Salmonella enterica subsp. enterica serovar Veneziana]|nr:hypothetical protein [Salmonella enterica subsp. enterica serovar Veneziana]HEA0266933.1 hypothetical protein [Salmonella enterica]
MNRIIRSVDTTTYGSFSASAKKLPVEVLECLKQAVKDLLKDPQPKRIRLEKLKGNNRPPIYTIHVTPNHSHKLSFEIDGDKAILRVVGTHKEIDRKP